MSPNRQKTLQRGKRPRDREHTRGLILQAAEKIFAEEGLAGARTETIAAAADVNKAMLHYYFRSKAGLYRAVLEKHLDEFYRCAAGILSDEGSASSVLLRYVEYHFNFVGSRPWYSALSQRLVMGKDHFVDQMIRRYSVPLYGKLTALIERGIKDGEFRNLDVRHTAISIVAVTVFYFHAAPVIRRKEGVDVFSPQQRSLRKEQVMKFIRYAVFKKPEAVHS